MKYEDMIDPPREWELLCSLDKITSAQVLILGVMELEYIHLVAKGIPKDRLERIKRDIDQFCNGFLQTSLQNW